MQEEANEVRSGVRRGRGQREEQDGGAKRDYPSYRMVKNGGATSRWTATTRASTRLPDGVAYRTASPWTGPPCEKAALRDLSDGYPSPPLPASPSIVMGALGFSSPARAPSTPCRHPKVCGRVSLCCCGDPRPRGRFSMCSAEVGRRAWHAGSVSGGVSGGGHRGQQRDTKGHRGHPAGLNWVGFACHSSSCACEACGASIPYHRSRLHLPRGSSCLAQMTTVAIAG